MNNKTLSTVTLGLLMISVAVGLIVYATTGHGLQIILWTAMVVFGISLTAMSFMYSKEVGKFGPADSTYVAVWGILVTVIGVISLLHLFNYIDKWILIAIFLIVLALVGISVALINGKKEGM